MTAEQTTTGFALSTGRTSMPARRGAVRSWLLTRGILLFLMTFQYARVTGDVRYYYRSTGALLQGATVDEVMVEYPPLAVLLTAGLRAIAGIQQDVYSVSFILLMIAVDVWFTRLLWRTGKTEGVWLWLWFVPALGPIVYARLDLLPAVLAGAAIVVALGERRRHRAALAGVLAGLGAVLKLFPLVVVPALWLHRQGRWWLLAAFAGTVAAGFGIAYALLGEQRILSPLLWQQDRGLQLESLFALPLLMADVFSPATWRVEYSDHLAMEVLGPGTGLLLSAAKVATGLAVVVLAVLWSRGVRLRSPGPAPVAWLAVATVCLVLLTNKVFSPQYMVWLATVMAALGVVSDEPPVRHAGRLFLLACVLTQGFYPNLYHFLIDQHAAMIVLLLLRDLVLIVLTWVVVKAMWTYTRRPGQGLPSAATTRVADEPRP